MLGKDSPTEKYPCLLFIYLLLSFLCMCVLYIHVHMHGCACMDCLRLTLGVFLSCATSYFFKDGISD